MVVEAHILKTAADMVGRAQHCAASLRGELEQLDKRKAEIESDLNAAEEMANRLTNFKSHNGAAYHCPCCWIEEESLNALSLKKGGEWRQDFYMLYVRPLRAGDRGRRAVKTTPASSAHRKEWCRGGIEPPTLRFSIYPFAH